MRRLADSHRCKLEEPELLHRGHARSRVRAGSGAPGIHGDALQGTAASAVNCSDSTMIAEDGTTLKRAVVEADRLRPCVVLTPAQGIGDVQIQQYVLGVGRAIGALTWEGMGSLAVQT